MTGRVGDLVILAALGAAVFGAITGFAAGRSANWELLRKSQLCARIYAGAMIAAVAVMEFALLTHDFSVRYVARVGSLSTPAWVTVVSLWSSLEGSILLWGLVLGIYVAVYTAWSRDRDVHTTPWALGTMHVVGAFFAFLIAGPANPFTPAPDPIPPDGPGPNPLLQNHILMVVHPPMLYLGYVGMVVPFGMAVGALLAGRLGPAWTQALRRALIVPWGFLTVGIVLGGWWAYEVLGWGGYWAWDPVENASFLPWLTATAALHAAMLPSRRDALKGWTVTLVVATFLLTLLGTFMTRSGVFNSVHSFTQSAIGPIFLGFLGVALVLCVLLLAARIDSLAGEGEAPSPMSREASFMVNNLIFVSLTFTVLLGTTFPLVMEAVKGVKLSVGEPYFNQVAVPAGVSILFLMGVGPALPWGEASGERIAKELGLPAISAAVSTATMALVLGLREPWPLACVAAATFAGTITLRELARPIRLRMREYREPLPVAVVHTFERGRRRVGGYVVHLGVIVIIVAVAVSHAYRIEREFALPRDQAVTFEGYTLQFGGSREVAEPHRTRSIATVEVSGPSGNFTLSPALNRYGDGNPIGTPAVHSTLTHDLYLSLVTLGEEQSTVHAYRNPGVLWIWIGAGVCVVGTLLAAIPGRRAAGVQSAPAQAAK